jgi:hypothetical protein
MKPLSIVAYFDGRLGHEKQTRGILQALADITKNSSLLLLILLSVPVLTRIYPCSLKKTKEINLLMGRFMLSPV